MVSLRLELLDADGPTKDELSLAQTIDPRSDKDCRFHV